MPRKLGRILEKASESLDIPVDVIGGLPRVEIRGSHEVIVESHSGIKEYGDACIVIDTPSGGARIRGSELTIRSMNEDRIVINGTVLSFEFI